jgi:hypothetical protein
MRRVGSMDVSSLDDNIQVFASQVYISSGPSTDHEIVFAVGRVFLTCRVMRISLTLGLDAPRAEADPSDFGLVHKPEATSIETWRTYNGMGLIPDGNVFIPVFGHQPHRPHDEADECDSRRYRTPSAKDYESHVLPVTRFSVASINNATMFQSRLYWISPG